MANYIATIANGGTRYRPYLASEIIAPDGQIERTVEPRIIEELNLDPETVAAVRKGMYLVTQGEGTAAYYFQGFPVSVAGKTGTAQNPHGADHAWFVAFAPYENPPKLL